MKRFTSLSRTVWDCKYDVVGLPDCRYRISYGKLRSYLGDVFHELVGQHMRAVLVKAIFVSIMCISYIYRKSA